MRNRQWHMKTKGIGLRLSLDTCSASLNVALHVALYLWPKVVSGEHVISLVTAKVTLKASTMGLLKKQKLERRFRNAKLVLFEKKTLMQIEIINPFVY